MSPRDDSVEILGRCPHCSAKGDNEECVITETFEVSELSNPSFVGSQPIVRARHMVGPYCKKCGTSFHHLPDEFVTAKELKRRVNERAQQKAEQEEELRDLIKRDKEQILGILGKKGILVTADDVEALISNVLDPKGPVPAIRQEPADQEPDAPVFHSACLKVASELAGDIVDWKTVDKKAAQRLVFQLSLLFERADVEHTTLPDFSNDEILRQLKLEHEMRRLTHRGRGRRC